MYMAGLVAMWLWRVFSPVFLLLGSVGNILCIVVLTRPGTRKSSTAVFLTALAVCDTCVLYTGLLRWWIIQCFGLDVRLLSDTGCRLHLYSIYVSSSLSSWLLVGVTCERITSIKWPHRVRVICTQSTAGCIVFAMTLVICVGSSHILYGTRLQYVQTNDVIENDTNDVMRNNTDDVTKNGTGQIMINGTGDVMRNDTGDVISTTWPPYTQSQVHFTARWECKAIQGGGYSQFFSYYYPWIDMCSYFLLPAICLSTGEICILREIHRSRRLRRSMQRKDAVANRKCKDRTSSVTIMLLTVNAVFVLCTTPISVFLIGQPYWTNPNDDLSKNLAWAIVNLLMYLNHSTNFALYFLSGARFRRKVREFFVCKGRRRDVSGLDTESGPSIVNSQSRRRSTLPDVLSSYPNTSCTHTQDHTLVSYPDVRPMEADMSPTNDTMNSIQPDIRPRIAGIFSSTQTDTSPSDPYIPPTDIDGDSTNASIQSTASNAVILSTYSYFRTRRHADILFSHPNIRPVMIDIPFEETDIQSPLPNTHQGADNPTDEMTPEASHQEQSKDMLEMNVKTLWCNRGLGCVNRE